MNTLAFDVFSVLPLIAWAQASRRGYWLRGVTYRDSIIPRQQEKCLRAALYFSVLSLIDMLLRRFGGCSRSLRVVLLWIPGITWAACRPLRVNSRDGSGFDPASQLWPIWGWLAKKVFKNCRIAMSEEWADLSAEEVRRWTDEHQSPYVIPMHPHGYFPIGGMINGLTWFGGGMQPCTVSGADLPYKTSRPGKLLHQNVFPDMKLTAGVASCCFWFPIFWEVYTKLGCIEATKPYLANALREGKTVALYPGGAAESGLSRPGRYVAYCRNRKGFIRLALEERVDLLPIYTFGEEAVLPQASSVFGPIAMVQKFVKEVTGLHVPPAVGGLPSAPPLTTVVGVPISLDDLWPAEVGGQVDDAIVDIAHQRYIDSQQKLFDRNKAAVLGNHGHASLEFL